MLLSCDLRLRSGWGRGSSSGTPRGAATVSSRHTAAGGKWTGGSSGYGMWDFSVCIIVSRKRSSRMRIEFLPLAQLRGLLADDVAGDRRVGGTGWPLAIRLLDHQLRLLVGQFEPGLLHQLAELVDAVLGAAPSSELLVRTR